MPSTELNVLIVHVAQPSTSHAARAIAAAFFDATGKHARRLPLKPAYVQALLET
jgi:CO/xanthine dehydrogenase Mo-binding subunit